MIRLRLFLSALFLMLAAPVAAEDIPADLSKRMESLSATLDEGGAGWSAYADTLHPDYSRWAVGELYQQRAAFIDALKEWWDYGMRVQSRSVEIVGADLTGDLAIIRLKTSETFIGPDGASGGFEGFVVNAWLREKGEWMLLSADITPAE